MQLLSQVFTTKISISQQISPFLSIYNNFSLGVLWKDFHNDPNDRWS